MNAGRVAAFRVEITKALFYSSSGRVQNTVFVGQLENRA